MLAGLLLAAASAGAVAPPPSGANPADVRCAIVSLVMAGDPNATIRTAGISASLYWFGRIDRGQPDAVLQQMLESEAKRMPADAIKSEGQRCGKEMEARGAAMQRIGNAITADAKQPGLR
jgi:hypothetical protein